MGDPTKNVCERLGANSAQVVNLDDWTKGTNVIVSIPGAFTPTCSINHIPAFVEKSEELKKKGINKIGVTAVNDPFVLRAMCDLIDPKQTLENLADGSGDLAKALGLDQDLSAKGLGIRAKRYAMILKDGKVTYLGIDAQGLDKSSAEAVLAAL